MSEPTMGAYPQLAGSFYNASAMMPHSGGRVAPQIPTVNDAGGGLFQATRMRMSSPDIPNNVNILAARSANMDAYYKAQESSLSSASGIMMGAGLVAGTAGMVAGGVLAGGAALVATPAMILASSALDRYTKERESTRHIQKALSGLNLIGNSMADPITGSMNLSSAMQIRNTLQSKMGGFSSDELKGVMEYAAKTGGLTGHTGNTKQITDRVLQLAKVTKEIVDIGDGITAADAAGMQQMLSGMGISTNTMLKHNIGKRLVTAGKTAGLTLQEVNALAQVSAQGYAQLGLSASQGALAGAYTTQAAHVIAGTGSLSEDQMLSIGGREGLQQGLFKAGATGMSNSMNRLIMGTMKLGRDGKLMIDTDMLDMAVSGKISASQLESRAKEMEGQINLLDTKSKNTLMAEIQRSMPELTKKVSEEITPAQQMNLAASGVKEIMNKTGADVKTSMEQYFGGDKQAIQAFTEYAKNLPQILQEQRRQNYLAEQDKLLKRASQGIDLIDNKNSMAKFLSGIGDLYDSTVEAIFSPTERAKRDLLNEEKNKYTNLGFINGLNNNTILGSSLTNTGITSGPYNLSLADIKNNLGDLSTTALTSNFQGALNMDLDNLRGTLGVGVNGAATRFGYDPDSYFSNKDYMNKYTANVQKSFNTLMKGKEIIPNDRSVLKSGTKLDHKDLNGRYIVKDAYGETLLLNQDGTIYTMTGKNTPIDPRKYLNIDQSAIDTNDIGEWMYQDTDSYSSIGYGDRYADIYNELRGDLGANSFTETLNKVFRDQVDTRSEEKTAIATIAEAGLTYQKLFLTDNFAVNKAKNASRDKLNEFEGDQKYRNDFNSLKSEIESELSGINDTFWDKGGPMTGLYYDKLLGKLNNKDQFKNLSEVEKQAILQQAMDDIKNNGTEKSKVGLAKFEVALQKAASVTNTKLTPGSDLSNVSALLGSDMQSILKSFGTTEYGKTAMTSALGTLSVNLTTGKEADITKLLGMDQTAMSRYLGVNLTKEQYSALSNLVSKSSQYSQTDSGKKEIKELFNLVASAQNKGQVLEDVNKLGVQKKFIEEARKYASSNELSQAFVQAYDTSKGNLGDALTGAVDKLKNSNIKTLLGADYEKLSAEQKAELREDTIRASKSGNPQENLKNIILKAQQYLNQSGDSGKGGSMTEAAVMKDIKTSLEKLDVVMSAINESLQQRKPLLVQVQN